MCKIVDDSKGFHYKNTKGNLVLTGETAASKDFGFLNLLLNPLNGQSLVEIGEMACATPAWSYRGLTLKTFFNLNLNDTKAKETNILNFSKCLPKINSFKVVFMSQQAIEKSAVNFNITNSFFRA